jgi:RNA polymerase sigma-70 factor (ECF subfamily)
MTTQDFTAETAGVPSPKATAEEKLAWLERTQGALDARGIALVHEVFDPILRAYGKRVYWRIVRWGVPPTDAEDVLQDVCITLYSHVARYGVQGNLRALFNRIARGRLSHYSRTQERTPESVCIPSSGSALPESEPDIDRAIDYRALARRLMPELCATHRVVVQLCILDEKTDAEAAAMLGIPEGTLKSQLRAAKRELRALASPLLPESQRKAA